LLEATYIGKLHPLIVHLPIGIILFGFVMILLQKWKKDNSFQSAINLSLGLGSITSIAACIFGYLLAQSGDYDERLINLHQWTGIGTALLVTLSYYFSKYQFSLIVLTVVLLSIAGHYGGSITHGEDFLLPPSIESELEINKTNDSSIVLIDTTHHDPIITDNSIAAVDKVKEIKSHQYKDRITPILEKKCYSCHSASKKKGGLRLDSEDFIKSGGKNGIILFAGSPDKSKLLTTTLLPEDDKKHMPPKGKPQLTDQEKNELYAWIKKGASFEALIEKVNTNTFAQNITIPASMKSTTTASLEVNEDDQVAALEVKKIHTSKEITPVEQPLIDILKQRNIIVSNIDTKSNYVLANFINIKDYRPIQLYELKAIDDQLARLKLSNLPVKNEDLKIIAGFINLRQLNLEKTNITDEGLAALQSLPNLESLNLYGTEITDEAVKYISTLKNLKSIFIWKTKITRDGISQLKKVLPQLSIDMGYMTLSHLDSSEMKLNKMNN
jgi:uncharacterized membrane protein